MLISPIVLSHCRTEVCTSRYTPLCVYSLLDPPRNCCFDEEIELRPSPHLPLFKPFFSFVSLFISGLSSSYLSGFFFLLFRPPPLLSCRRPCAAFIIWGLFVYFFALTRQYFLLTFFTTPQFHSFFYSSLALCRNSPQPKCNAQIEDYSHCPVLTHSYSHG